MKDADAGKSEAKAAASCKEVLELNYKAPTGTYYIKNLGQTICEMDFEGGGWLLVMRGIGNKDLSGWSAASGAYRAGDSKTDGKTFKLADDTINAFPHTVMRMNGGKSDWPLSRKANSFYWCGCNDYAHNGCSSSGANDRNARCNTVYADPECKEVINKGTANSYCGQHWGVGDWRAGGDSESKCSNGDADYLHTSHNSYAFCIRKLGAEHTCSANSGNGHACCGAHGDSAGCNVEVWLR